MITKKQRAEQFKELCSHFEHEMLSDLVTKHRIKNGLFTKFERAVDIFYRRSMDYEFQNKTPNGLLTPKTELEKEYNDVTAAYRNILFSLNIQDAIHLWNVPAVRLKEEVVFEANKNRPRRSELPHSDAWVGWDKDCILVVLPVLGDTEHNRVDFFDMPDHDYERWLTKLPTFEDGQKWVGECKRLPPNYEKGCVYIADIGILHQTVREDGCGWRVSTDTPLFRVEPEAGGFGTETALDYGTLARIGKDRKLSCTTKMGEITGIDAVKRPLDVRVVG